MAFNDVHTVRTDSDRIQSTNGFRWVEGVNVCIILVEIFCMVFAIFGFTSSCPKVRRSRSTIQGVIALSDPSGQSGWAERMYQGHDL